MLSDVSINAAQKEVSQKLELREGVFREIQLEIPKQRQI